jgi:hypothetical protein
MQDLKQDPDLDPKQSENRIRIRKKYTHFRSTTLPLLLAPVLVLRACYCRYPFPTLKTFLLELHIRITLVWIRIPLFNLIADPDPTYQFDVDSVSDFSL